MLWLPLEMTHWVLPLLGMHTHGSQAMAWATFAASTAALAYVGAGFYAGRGKGFGMARQIWIR